MNTGLWKVRRWSSNCWRMNTWWTHTRPVRNPACSSRVCSSCVSYNRQRITDARSLDIIWIGVILLWLVDSLREHSLKRVTTIDPPPKKKGPSCNIRPSRRKDEFLRPFSFFHFKDHCERAVGARRFVTFESLNVRVAMRRADTEGRIDCVLNQAYKTSLLIVDRRTIRLTRHFAYIQRFPINRLWGFPDWQRASSPKLAEIARFYDL